MANEALFYRELLDALGIPPMRGAAEGEEPVDSDTPESEETAPEGDTGSEETQSDVNWEQRYGDLRPEYDRGQQLIAAARRGDPEALEELGLEIQQEEEEDDEWDTDEDDLDDPYERRFSRLEAAVQAREEAEAEAEFVQLRDDYIDAEFDRLAESENREFSDEEKELLASAALVIEDDEGLPGVQQAYDRLAAVEKSVRENYGKSKRASQAPSGQAGEAHQSLDSVDDIAEALAAEMEANTQ